MNTTASDDQSIQHATSDPHNGIRNVVILKTATDWRSVRRIASQQFRTSPENWLVFVITRTPDALGDLSDAWTGDIGFLAERSGARTVLGTRDELFDLMGKIGAGLENVLIFQPKGIVGKYRGYRLYRRLRSILKAADLHRMECEALTSGYSIVHAADNPKSGRKTLWNLAGVLGLVGFSAYICWEFRGSTPIVFPYLVMITSVVMSAVLFGRWGGLAAAAAGMLLLNFLFVIPIKSIRIDSVDDIMTLVIFLVVGSLTSLLVGRASDLLSAAREKQAFNEIVLKISRKLTETVSLAKAYDLVAGELEKPLNARVFIIDYRDGEKAFAAELARQTGYEILPADLLAAQIAMETGEPAGYGTSVANDTILHFQPVSGGNTPSGVIVIDKIEEQKLADPRIRVLIEVVADLSGIAVERIIAEEEVEQVKAKETTESLHNTVLSAVSHDFRTPLSTIIGSTTSLQAFRDKYDDDTIDSLLEDIFNEATRLDRFVSSVLDLTKLEHDDLESRLEPVDLVDIVDTVAESISSHLANFNFERDFDHPIPFVSGDAMLLEKIVQNFLENATKYSSAGSSITAILKSDGATVVFTVADSGIGIAPENLERIFERLFKVQHASHTQSSPGLGLSICKEIARLHNGRVWAESDGQGKGSRFNLELPVDNVVVLENSEMTG